MEVYNPPELPEAWSKIDLSPAPLVIDIEGLRRLLPTMEAEIAQSKGKRSIVAFEEGVLALPVSSSIVRHPDDELQLHLARCHFVQSGCRNVIRGLDNLIPRLRRVE